MKLSALEMQKEGRISGSRKSTAVRMGMPQTSYIIAKFGQLTNTKATNKTIYYCGQLLFRTSQNLS